MIIEQKKCSDLQWTQIFENVQDRLKSRHRPNSQWQCVVEYPRARFVGVVCRQIDPAFDLGVSRCMSFFVGLVKVWVGHLGHWSALVRKQGIDKNQEAHLWGRMEVIWTGSFHKEKLRPLTFAPFFKTYNCSSATRTEHTGNEVIWRTYEVKNGWWPLGSDVEMVIADLRRVCLNWQ